MPLFPNDSHMLNFAKVEIWTMNYPCINYCYVDCWLQKAEVMKGVVSDLEDQIKDYETLIEEYEKQQADWEEIK